ncbi:unnamed protein product [Schistosoma rodhaini]|uniref:Desmoplakin SH3 domain-containing protein n=1 Tax=Schistosoma rodhaini TaxID=6188 RepID=A0AA85ERF5_9TREM|nr:unnamed protein product [Schistosoma rodhaini]
MATESLQARLTDFERQARGVCIGVNHLALDSERVRQAELLQKIIQLEKDIQQSSAQKSHLPEAAAEIRDDVKNNTSALRYLETISQLENSFTVLTENVTETSVQLSAPKELKDEVHVKKELTGNVKSCWTYVSQLARLSQVHIRNAAEYHQFHHAVNEAEASLKARVRMTEPRNTRALPATLKNCTILANELREHLNHMIHLWGRSGNLLEESRRIVPVHLRLGCVIDGLSTNTESASPVMARMLTSLTGPNYELKEGEEVRVISNKDDQHFWTVQTNSGIVKIPSVCLWISDPDLEAVKRSVILREKCIESWDLLVERSRERLRSYYSCLLNQMAENGDIQYQHKIAMDNFLEDLRGLLLPNDTRATELSQAIYAFTDRLKMTDINRQRSSHGGVFLREQDIVCMHSPLLRLRDHERQMDHLRAQSELAGTHMTNYLREIDADQKRVDQELSLIDQLQHESQSQLDQLINRVKRWSSRYEHEPNVDSSISNSRMSSSLKSSTISDNWAGNNQMYPIDARSPQSIVRETSRLSSRTRSESIPRPVLDAITQIGVTTKTTGTQISRDDGDGGRNEIDLSISKRQFMPATIPERKQVRNAITQIGVSKVDAGTQDDYHGYSPKRSVKEVLCQIGQITANASCQTLEHYKLQQTLKKPTLDAVVQSGVITKNNSTQSEYITETVVKMDIPESQKAARKYSVLDAICQIGQVTQTTGTQTEVKNIERNKKNLGVQAEMKKAWQHTVNTNEAACQIGRITINASTEMSPMMVSKEEVIKQEIKKSDIICQIGKVQMTKSTQTNATEKLKNTTIKDSANQYEIQKASTSSQVDVLTEKTYKRTLKSVNDVICQVGQVNHEASTQSVEYVTTRPAHKDTGIDPIHVWEKKTANDVVTQTGIVHTSKITQAELVQEQPVYVKAIETQDVPITSYRNTVDAYQQADLIKHMLRKPSSDVVCQVGSVMESSGIQIDEPHKTSMLLAGTQSAKTPTYTKEIQTDMGFRMEPKFVSKAVNDVICQVGQVNHEVSSQTGIPSTLSVGVDPRPGVPVRHLGSYQVPPNIEQQSIQVQADIKQTLKHIDTQTEAITRETLISTNLVKEKQVEIFDVTTQFDKVTKEKDVQTFVTCRSKETQTIESSPDFEVKMRSQQTFTRIRSNNYDVQTQSGTINISQAFQTLLDYKPTTEKRSTGMQHEVDKGVVETTYHEPQTQETPTQTERARIKDQQTFTSIELKTFDVQTQFGSILKTQAAQTPGEQKTVVEVRDITMQHQKSPEPIVHKKLQAIVQPPTINTETQTMVERPPPVILPPKVFDVQTQSGSVTLNSETQTPQEHRPVVATKDASVYHETRPVQSVTKMLQAIVVRPLENMATQTDFLAQPVVMPMVQTTHHEPQTQETPTQTERARIKDQQTFTSIELKTFDVQTQFGSILKTQAAQTPGEQKTVVEVRDITMQHQKSPEPIVHKKLQAIVQPPTINTETQTMVERPPPVILPPKVFDVQTQSGSVTLNSETQTPQEHRPIIEMKDLITQHEKRPEPIVHKKLQAIVQPPTINTETQTMVERPPPVILPPKVFDVQTQSGSVTLNSETQTPQEHRPIIEMKDLITQHEKRPEPIVHKKLQAIVQPPTINTETQTMVERPPPVILPPKVFDVQTQSGSVTLNSETQTPQEHRPIIEMKDLITQHEKRPEPIVHKKLQAIVQPPTINTETQTMVERPPPVILPPKVFDVQTQSGSVTLNSETQTPQEHRPIIEMKDLITQHEKRPEPIVHKKLQAIVQPPTINTETQTMVERPPPVILPPKVFDVQTQSGSVTLNSETQTTHEPKIIPAIKDASVIHEPHHIQTVNKKLQAVVYHPSDDVCLQTEEVTVQPVKPVPQAFSRAPQVEHKQTQAEWLKTKTKTFDIQAQSGIVVKTQSTQTILEEQPIFHTADVSVIHSEKSPLLVNKKLQATIRQSVENTSTQTDTMAQVPTVLPKTTFDVVTQSGTIHCAKSVQTIPEERPVFHTVNVGLDHTEKSPSLVGKKLQATMRQSVENTSTQTDTMAQVPTVLPKTTFDVVTQSGTIHCAQSVQTIPEERPVFHTVNVGLDHTEKSPSLVGKKLQATMRQSVENTSTQTDTMAQVPTVLPKTTFDVVTQSGTIHCAQSVQTIPEERPVFHTVSVGVDLTGKLQSVLYENVQATMRQSVENTSTQTDTMAQVPTVLPKTTFDVVTQSGTIHCAKSVQTIPEERPVFHTVNVGLDHTEKSPSLVGKKLQATIRQSVENTSTQTDTMAQVPTVLPKTTFDVVTQSGTIHCAQSVQTIPEERPVFHTVNVGLDHTEKSPSLVGKKLQATIRQSVENTSTQTDTMAQVPTVLPKTTFDVVTQSGTIHCAQSVQTIPEERPVFHTVSEGVDLTGKLQSVLYENVQATMRQSVENTSTQTDTMAQVPTVLPKTTFDVVTQSGTLSLNVGCQAVLISGDLLLNDVAVDHVGSINPCFSQGVQVGTQVECRNVEIQCVIKDKNVVDIRDVDAQFDVLCRQQETQTFSLPSTTTKEGSVQHAPTTTQLINKKLQVTVSQSIREAAAQTYESIPVVTVPTMQTIYHSSQTHERPSQTESMGLFNRQTYAHIKSKTIDVETQSGIICKSQGLQTKLDHKLFGMTKENSTQYEAVQRTMINIDIQADARHAVAYRYVQTDESQLIHIKQKHQMNVQTQSGIIQKEQGIQTREEVQATVNVTDVTVTHEFKTRQINKKLQATIMSQMKDTIIQTEPEGNSVYPTATKPTFDVQTQSGSVTINSETQTTHEPKIIPAIKDASVIHEPHHIQTVNKKLQAVVYHPSDDVCLQTEEVTVQPVKPVPQAFSRAPQVEHKQTQAEWLKTKTKTFDIQAQSGIVVKTQSTQTILEEQPIFHTADVSVIHSEKSPLLVNKKLQATIRQSVENTSTQTDTMAQVPTVLPKTTFDVVTQSGTIHCAQSVQTIPEERPVFHTVNVGLDHTEKSPSLVGKKLQATMRQSVENTSTQTDTMAQVPTVLPKTTFDVVTQSGTIHCAQSVQTIPEERPVFHTVDVSVDHIDNAPIVRSTVSSTVHTLPNTSQSTQTIPTKLADTFCQATLSSITYDVQIQSGVIHSVDGTQTVDLTPPIAMKEMSVVHEKEPTILKGKKLQVRCDSTDLGVQTDQITPIVQPTISSTMHTLPNTSQSIQTIPTKLADTFCQATLSSITYDVQIQSGVIHSVDGTQTVDLTPPIAMKEMSVVHEKEPTILKGKKLQVRCDSTDLGVQTDQITPIVQPTISSTMHTLPNTSQSIQTIPTKLADTFCQATLSSITYDVQIQSGVIHSVDGTQTVDLTPPIAMKEMSVVHEKEPTILKGKKLQVRCDSTDLGVQTDQITPIVQPTISSTMHTLPNTSQSTQTIPTKLADTFCQATLSSITYDVQIQSGVIHSVDGTQTVDLTPPIAMKEMSVVHEKEPTILKGKKLQVRCDSTDLGVQTDHTMSTVHLDGKLTQTALVHYTDVSCQYTELTKPSSTSHVVTSRVVSIQTDVPFSTNIRVDQRNKKFQVNLISPSSPKTPTNVASIGTQTSDYRYQDISIGQVDKTTVSSVDAYMVHDSVSNVTSTSQAIPKIKIDQECQVKITPQQYQKKLQCGPSFSTLKNTSSQTIQDSCLRDHQRTSLSSSIGVQVSNVRPVVTVDTGTQETRPSETSPSPLQVKNKKLQVYPSKLGEQVEEEFIHPQETICKGMPTSLTEITQTDECLLKNIECFKCISRGSDKKTIDKDVQSEEKSIRTKQTASSTVKSNYFTRILQMETIPDKPKAPDTSDVLKLYRESGYRAKGESRDVQTDAFLLGSIQLPESKEVDGVGKFSKKTTIVQLEKLTTDKCVDTMPFEKGLIESQTSYHDIQTSERRNVRLPKETPWPEAQATNVLQDIQFEIRHPQMIDSSGSYSPQQNSVSVSVRPTTHMLTHAESTSRSGNGKVKTPYQYSKPDVVSWGVQFAPVTLTGVTQTTESSKHKLAIDSSVNISVQTDAVEDDYYIKRVVTTIARKGLSSYCRRGPVAKKIVEHTDLLTSSLPSNLDEEFDEETTIGPRTTKVTTMQKRGDRRVVHEELLTEDYRERGSSLDSRVAHGQFPRETHPQDIDLHEMHEHETDIYTDAEICLQNLLKVWGEQYLLSRLRTIGRYSELSVSLDRSIHTAEKSRLVEAKTQFTSTGNLVSQIRNLENIGTQTSDILLITRPPHKNKRIQRGRSFISGGTNQPPPTRSGSVVSPLSPTTEELTSHHRQHGITSMQTRTSHPFNLATTTFTETTQEQSTFSIEHTVQTYTCPTCGSQANIPVTVHSQIQPQTLPITQLKDAQSQTRFIGQMTTDNNCTYLPTYLSDEEVIRINQSQKIEDREFSMVTWHPAEIRDTERRKDSDTSNQIRDEVWVDSPGKLLELKITGVIVPGTSKIVSASEAFYRGLLRVVYWDYEKLGPRQSSVDSTVSIPLADAVISKAVRLASDRISTETQPSLDAKIVWRTPEIQRSRYLVHSIRPDAGQNKHNPINLDVASAIRAGLIDKETGQMLFTHSVYESPFSTDSPISKKGDSSSDQTERLSVREAIVRGFLVAELIEPESSYITKQSLSFIVPSTSYSHSPTDVDI